MAILDLIRWRKRPSLPTEPELPTTARSVAIIMDGNGRWARGRGLPVIAGHRAGTRALRRTVEAAPGPRRAQPVRVRVLDGELDAAGRRGRATSWTCWRRPSRASSRSCTARACASPSPAAATASARRSCALMEELEQRTGDNPGLRLYVAFDYGGRAEILEACRQLVRDGVAPEDIDADVAPRAPGLPRPARPGPRHPHVRRAAPVQLPALAERLRRARVLARPLARLRARRPRRRHRRVRHPPPQVRRSVTLGRTV